MKSTLTRALCSLVVCLTCGVTFAQPGPPGAGAAGRVTLDPGPGGPGGQNVGYAVGSPFGPQVGVNLNPGDGIGWNDGYYGADVFLPLHFDPGVSMIFGMIKVSATGNGDGVVNLGSGYRYRHLGLNRIFGFAGFLDVDDGHEETYKRVGVSFESLGRYLDFRANTYLVLGDNSNRVSSNLTGDPFFVGNFLALSRRTVTEDAYGGADFEVGGPLPYIGRYGLSGYIGPYWLHNSDSANDESTIGVKARLQAQINEDLTIGAQFSNDDIFSNNAFVNVTWTIPDGRPSRWFRQLPQRERMAQAPQREWRVAVNKYTSVGNEYLINPADNQPYQFAHIFPSNTSAGNGTIESPFNSTANFVNDPRYDVIYVRPGNAANLDDGIALLDNQRLLSTAVTHQIVAVQGTFTIPGFTGGALPVLTNPNLVNAPVVQLASNNEVSGFQIDGSNGADPIIDGIRSQLGGVGGGFNINRNEFVNNRRATDILFVGDGYGRFVQNTLTGTGTQNGLGFDSDNGFRVVTQGAGNTLDLLLANNTVTGYQGFGEDLNRNGLLDGAEDVNGNGQLDQGTAFEVTARDGATVNANAPLAAVNPTGIFNNLETASGTGLLINGVNGGVVNASILNNIFQNNVDINTGMRVVANNGTVNLTEVDSNVITGNNGNGIALLVRNSGFINGVFTNNDLRNNALASLLIDGNNLVFPDNGAVNITSFTDNNLDRGTQGTAGILINTVNADVTLAGVLRNQITNGTSFGIGGRMENGFLNLFVGDGTAANANDISGNGDAGIGLQLAGNNISDIRILRNLISNSTAGATAGFSGEGIALRYTDTASYFTPTPLNLDLVANPNLAGVNRTIDQNTITGNANFGILVQADQNAAIDSMVITRNLIDLNGNNGIQTNRTGSGSIRNFVIAENVITNNGVDGIWLIASTGPTQDTYLIARNNINNNTSDGIHLEVNGDAQMRTDILNNNIADNGLNGILTLGVSNVGDTPDVTGSWLGNVIARNAANGIQVNTVFGTVGQRLEIGRNGVDADGFSLGNMIIDNGLAGILFTQTSIGNVDIQNNIITGNGAQLAANNGAGIDIESVNSIPLQDSINATIDNNLIRNNRGDGIELLVSAPIGGLAPSTLVDNHTFVSITNNRIELNDARGLDVLNRGDGFGFVNVDTNMITGNGQEAAYFVFTSDVTQQQNVLATAALNATAPVSATTPDAEGNLAIRFHNNTVTGNGILNGNFNPFESSGLVIRVGTSDAGSPNFASDAAGSGVVASVENNVMTGNFGTDVHLEVFRSTVLAVPDTLSDPLARIDLEFNGNTVGVLDALAGLDNSPTANATPDAFYNNASTVKSNAYVFQDAGITRARNATRLPLPVLTLVTTPPNNVPAPTFGTQSVVDDTPLANAVAPAANRFQSTIPTPNPPTGTFNSLSTNASEFVLRFLPLPNGGVNNTQFRTITTYTVVNVGPAPGVNRGDFTFSVPFPAAPAAGDQFQIDYLRVMGMGVSTMRVSAAGNNIGAVINGFGDTVPLDNSQFGEEDYRWDGFAPPVQPPFTP